jgi:amino acid adenylation domain-containing protein
MNDLSQRIANLSPAKRTLLEQRPMKKSAAVANKYAILRRAMPGPCPLSFAQQRLWFLDQLEPNSPLYNIARAVRLSGILSVEALQKALDTIVARHEALRTTFVFVEDSPVQVVVESRSVELTMIDLSRWPEAEREAKVHHLLIAEARRPFNLSHDLMLRATLLRLSEQEHALLLVMHHIASDGWSMGIFLRELSALYAAFATGEPSPLPELPIQYADFAIWQRQWLQGEVLEKQLTYWKRQLGGNLPVLELPADRPRPAVQTYRGACFSFVLSKTLSAALKALGRREGVTLFMVLLAAFKVLLSRYTGQEDIAVGTPIAGRTRVETEGLIGFFVNTLVLRTDLSGDPTFRELLGRIQEMALGAYAYQEAPFERLVEELRPERNLNHSPLFQVLFVLQNASRSVLELPSLAVHPLEVDRGTAKFEVTLSLVEEEEGIRGVLEYNTDLFEAATITRMLGHFRSVLEGIVANPEQRLSELPLLAAAEAQQLLGEWNNTKKAYPQDQCLHQLFEAQVAQTPEAIAVVCGKQHLSYQELNKRANQLAHHLQSLGVGPEVLVGLCMERSLELVVGLLGILKAGGGYVPLDPTYPSERLAFMLADAQVAVLLTQSRLVEGLPVQEAQVVCLEADGAGLAQQSQENPVSGTTAANLAYVIYTSGSTGKPKGVQIPHGAVVNFLHAMRQHPGLTNQDTLLAVTTLSFDIAALELYLPLSVGARVVMVSREVAADGVQLLEELTTAGATVMQATPATWRLLLEAGWQGSKQLKILCGGETLPREVANQLRERGGSLWNLYGPTETTIWSTLSRIDSAPGPVPIGRPIANTQIYILDRHLHPVPIGVAGELYIGGAGMARGYLNRPALTAEKFIPHPFSDEPGARLYKTGDLARYRPDGSIEYLGRLDQQVKVRGFRIELGEIEIALSHHPAVQQAVVLAREDTPSDKWLVAYIVPCQPVPTVSELHNFLKTKLPEYMVPSAFVLLDALPLTPNGKVDHRALPMPDQTRSALEEAFVAPRTPVEEIVTGIWAEILGLERVGIHDNFFALGGHSLRATQVISRLRNLFQVEVSLRRLFDRPTIAELAAALEQAKESPAELRPPALSPASRELHRMNRPSRGV